MLCSFRRSCDRVAIAYKRASKVFSFSKLGYLISYALKQKLTKLEWEIIFLAEIAEE